MPPPKEQPPLRHTDDNAARTATNGHHRSRGIREDCGTDESEYGDQFDPSQEQFQLSPQSGPRHVRGGSSFFVSSDERPNVEPERLARSLALSSDIRPGDSEPERLARSLVLSSDIRPSDLEPEWRLARSLVLSSDIRPGDSEPERLARSLALSSDIRPGDSKAALPALTSVVV